MAVDDTPVPGSTPTAPTMPTAFAALLAGQPHRRLLIGLGVGILALAVGLALAWRVTDPWHPYEIRPLGLGVDLPARPEAAADSTAAAPTYESRSKHVAVLLAAQAAPANAQLEALAAGAMNAIQARPDVQDLRYELRGVPLAGSHGLQVSAVFVRDGVPSRVTGLVGLHGTKTWQVLAFYSDAKGAQMASRVLRSLRILP